MDEIVDNDQIVGIIAAILIAPIMRQASTGDKECLAAIKNGKAIKDCAGEAWSLFREVVKQNGLGGQ